MTMKLADGAETSREVFSVSITQGCIDQGDINWNGHSRAKNWTATIIRDVTKPGELERTFWACGSNSWVKIPSDLGAGDHIEVAADYYSGKGRRSESRTLLRVLTINEKEIVFRASSKPSVEPYPVEADYKRCAKDGISLSIQNNIPKVEAEAEAAPATDIFANFTSEQLIDELRRRGIMIETPVVA